jgi:hypothetical protein
MGLTSRGAAKVEATKVARVATKKVDFIMCECEKGGV